MIKLNSTNYKTTVKFTTKENKLNLLNDEVGAINLLSATNEIFIVLDSKENAYEQLVKNLFATIEKYQINLNVDFDTLKPIFKSDLEKSFSDLYSALSFSGYAMENYKKEKIKQFEFNIISKEKISSFEVNEKAKAEAVNYARDLQETPPNIGTSVYYANKIKKDAEKIAGVKVTILGKAESKKLNMNLLLAVNAGSLIESQVVIVEYCSDANLPKTGLVGKGITFDSGGYNLKPAQHMKGMKFDMSGAAIVISTVMALAKSKAKANVVAVGLFTDNRIGYTATFPDSVITAMNGKTVVIEDTDAEGRLVLADGLTYAAKELKVDQLIDVATLTGAVAYALGRTTGIFSHNEKLIEDVNKASLKTNEVVWRLPILPRHLKQLQKDARGYADLTSCAKVYGEDSSYAAAFLNEFTESKPYLHLDVAGSADIEQKAQGVMVKTLFELLKK
ncbi:M17 family metallopeptidase [Mesoplasma corruscae]|uniref:Probable cytosol aminopeptidase n=1 Tax=Mesoplasma corruscae TaxID=216874 RepID=A0A2S5RH38_9MOLU|nr:M17 family metallopeptidase [Mesoplasma corruscae]PPE06607.1 leucyl aminopeptidase [Mesoplasma corruscae]